LISTGGFPRGALILVLCLTCKSEYAFGIRRLFYVLKILDISCKFMNIVAYLAAPLMRYGTRYQFDGQQIEGLGGELCPNP
jgi:hypothetical protein